MAATCWKIFSDFNVEEKIIADFSNQLWSSSSDVTLKSIQLTVLESQGPATKVCTTSHPESNMEEMMIIHGFNLADGSDENCLEKKGEEGEKNGDFIANHRQGMEGTVSLQLDSSNRSNVVSSGQHFPARLSEESPSPVSDFSNPNDNQIPLFSSGLTVKSAQHNTFERTHESDAKAYQIDNLDSNVEVEIPRDKLNLSGDSEKALAESETIGDVILDSGQGPDAPMNGFQQDCSILSNLFPSNQHFPADLFQGSTFPAWLSDECPFPVSDFSNPNDSQILSFSSGLTVKSVQHNIFERTHESDAKAYQIDNLDSNVGVEIPRDTLNLLGGSEKALAESETNGYVILNNGHCREAPLNGFQQDCSILSNVFPSSQHFPADLCQGSTFPARLSDESPFPVSDFSDPNDHQILSLSSGLTVKSAQHNILERTPESATIAYQIDNLERNMEVEIRRDKLNLLNCSDEDCRGMISNSCKGLEGSLDAFQQDFSIASNAVLWSQLFPAGLSKESICPCPDFSVSNIMLESEEEVNVDFPMSIWNSYTSNTTKAPRFVHESVPHFQSDFGGNSPPVALNNAPPPDSSQATPFRPSCVSTAPCEHHLGYPIFARLQSPEAIKLHYLTASSPRTKRYRNIEPKPINPNRAAEKDPLEIATEDICKNRMKRVSMRQVNGLVEKLTRVIDSHKRCRDERKPIHIRPECAFKEDSTASDCCWTKKFGGNFPDGNSIMESFQQIVTRIVVQAMKDRDKVLSHGFVRSRCDEWFKLHMEVGPSRTELQLRGKAKTDGMTVLAKSLGIRVDQVAKLWASYRQKISRERLLKKRRMEKSGGETEKYVTNETRGGLRPLQV